MNDSNMKNPHPWGNFLNARKICIDWMYEEMKYDDMTIAEYLSMDAIQVYSIRNAKKFMEE